MTSTIVCSPPLEDWSALVNQYPNVLISGPQEATGALVREVTPSFLSPVRRVSCDALRGFPPGGGTLILDDVHALDRQQQKMLLGWLNDRSHAETQVISITPAPLYEQVQAGPFLPALYYRLNIIYLEARLVGAGRKAPEVC